MSLKKNATVIQIPLETAKPFILLRHYAKRLPPVSFAFGLFIGGLLRGVVTYGVPSSSALRSGICGKENSENVIELNRLVCDHEKNMASFLVSKSIKLIPMPKIIVSYADTAMNHVGYVYQACNFIYTGLSAKRTDWKIRGMEHLHGQTIGDISRNCEGKRSDFLREKFGDDFYLEDRSRKHRYILIHADRRSYKKLLREIRYNKLPYPKGESIRYNEVVNQETQMLLL